MAGAKCPHCGELTLFETNEGKKCDSCGYEAKRLIGTGKGGRGKKCPMCGSFKLNEKENGKYKCRECGTEVSIPD